MRACTPLSPLEETCSSACKGRGLAVVCLAVRCAGRGERALGATRRPAHARTHARTDGQSLRRRMDETAALQQQGPAPPKVKRNSPEPQDPRMEPSRHLTIDISRPRQACDGNAFFVVHCALCARAQRDGRWRELHAPLICDWLASRLYKLSSAWCAHGGWQSSQLDMSRERSCASWREPRKRDSPEHVAANT